MEISNVEWEQLKKFFLDQTGLSMQEDILLLYHFTKKFKFQNILELGVGWEANSAKAFCYAVSQLTGSAFTGVDISQESIDICVKSLKKYDLDKYITFILSDSVEFLKSKPEGLYDCIFIDTNHEKQQTTLEIMWSTTRIKQDGCIYLHDTRKPGVKTAIDYCMQNPLLMFREFNTLAGLGLITKKNYKNLLQEIWNLKFEASK